MGGTSIRNRIPEVDPPDAVSQFLAGHRLFSGLPAPANAELARETLLRTYPKGHYLYQSGDPAVFVFIIKSGLVALTDLDEHGHTHPVQTHSAGHVFGLGTVVLGIPRRFTASAVTRVGTLLIPKATFYRAYRTFPDLAYRVAEELATMLCRSEQTTFHFSLSPVASRVARFLLDSSGKEAALASSPRKGTLELSRQDLALVVGTSRETVTRVLTRLSRSGLISIRRQKVLILKPDELLRLAEA